MATKSQRRCATLLVVLSVGYALLFAPPNLTGSADASMLAAFELDEFGQYKVLWRMTRGGDENRSGLSRFICYEHYYYGFPFFLVSAALFWPLKIAYISSGAPGLTQMSMLLLRQLSPVFMLAAILGLVFAWTRFRDPLRSVGLFALLASIPAVVQNNLWWHPDSLATLFVVFTIVALNEDRGRLGRWFIAAAVLCGLATGTKVIGFWFFGAVALHLVLQHERLGWSELAKRGTYFVMAMALTIVASNPHLLIPSEARETFEILVGQSELNASGWEVRGETGIASWYDRALSRGFGFWWFHLLMLTWCALTIRFDTERRNLALTIVAWVLPISLFLIFGVAKNVERYFLPILLPLTSCLASPAPWRLVARRVSKPSLRIAVGSAFAIAILIQVSAFAVEDVRRYRRVLHREETSPSLAFTRRLEREILPRFAPDQKLRIFRDATLYLRPLPQYEVHLRWRTPEHRDLVEIQPDLILLRQAEIDQFREESIVEESFDPEQAARSHRFYRDVRNDSIPGYQRILETDFGVAFARADVGEQQPAGPSREPSPAN